MKKKFLAVAMAAVLALGAIAFAGCSSSSNTANTNSNSSSSSSKTTLIVGFDQDYPPYGFVADDGSYTGFDLDLAKLVAEDNGWDIKLEPIDWDAKDALIAQGSITCIWNGFTMEGREDNYTFSEPYMLNKQVIVVKKDSGIASEADLAGKTVITQADSGALDVLSDEEGKKALADTFKSLTTIDNYNNAFMQLESGLVDAVACDSSIASYQMSANADKYVVLTTLSEEHYAVGFKKGNTEMADAVTASLKKLNESGKVKELIEKYAEYDMSYDNWCLK